MIFFYGWVGWWLFLIFKKRWRQEQLCDWRWIHAVQQSIYSSWAFYTAMLYISSASHATLAEPKQKHTYVTTEYVYSSMLRYKTPRPSTGLHVAALHLGTEYMRWPTSQPGLIQRSCDDSYTQRKQNGIKRPEYMALVVMWLCYGWPSVYETLMKKNNDIKLDAQKAKINVSQHGAAPL